MPVEHKNEVLREKTLYNYPDFRSRILERLAMPEYNPRASELCYLGPYLDSMYKYDRVVHQQFSNYSTTSVDLYLPNINIILIDFGSEKFLFSSLLMNDLFRYNNESIQKEIVPEREKICHYTDVKEFQRMLKYANLLGLDTLSRKGVADLLKKCFLTFELGKTHLKSGENLYFEKTEDLEYWKEKHLGVYKNNVELPFDSSFIYQPLDRWGLLIFNESDPCQLSILKKIFPNTTKVTSGSDMIPNYLDLCND